MDGKAERSAGPTRRTVLSGTCAVSALALSGLPLRAAQSDRAIQVLETWYRLVLELVRHTPTYSPPVASRAFAYLGVTAHEVCAATVPGLRSLAGQLGSLTPGPRTAGGDVAVALNAALSRATAAYFASTGPTGQRALAAMRVRLAEDAGRGVAAATVAASTALGIAIADHVQGWSASDGGAIVENMGFPLAWERRPAPDAWVPTSTLGQQQTPLLPGWGGNRTFALPAAGTCSLPPPPSYSEEPGSAFHAEAAEVVDISRALTDEQADIARFWSDDPMLSPTPPGHWISILLQIARRDGMPADRLAAALAVLGVGMADAFIACWHDKYRYDLVRPVTYIRRHIDPAWEALLITPPFPEYPSGHSTLSGAAATVLTALFGDSFAFTDATHEDDGLAARQYPGFWAAAEEAAMSRLYGGIHFRSAVERGLDQGRCVGAFAARLVTRG